MASTFEDMKREIENGWDIVLWSESYGYGDAAALVACVYFGCAQAYLGYRLNDLRDKVGEDFLKQVIMNKGKILENPAKNLEMQMGDAYWSVYHKVYNPFTGNYEKITTERYVRLYLRMRKKSGPQPDNMNCLEVARINATMDLIAKQFESQGFMGGFPNFHQARLPSGEIVHGTLLFSANAVEVKDVNISDFGNIDRRDMGAMMRAANDYAYKNGYGAGIPTFHIGPNVYGVVLLKQGSAIVKDVLAKDLGNPQDIGSLFRAVNDYAIRERYISGFPNFHQRIREDGELVYGVAFLNAGTAVPRDVKVNDLNLPLYNSHFCGRFN